MSLHRGDLQAASGGRRNVGLVPSILAVAHSLPWKEYSLPPGPWINERLIPAMYEPVFIGRQGTTGVYGVSPAASVLADLGFLRALARPSGSMSTGNG